MARKRRNQKRKPQRKPQRKHKATQENTTNGSVATKQEEFVWTVERKIELMNCMIGRKPAGLHKHISMLLIKINLSERLKMNVPIKAIWSYLNTHWDMDKADEIEDYQIKTIKNQDFDLPQTEEWISLIKEQEALINSKVIGLPDIRVDIIFPRNVNQPSDDIFRNLMMMIGWILEDNVDANGYIEESEEA